MHGRVLCVLLHSNGWSFFPFHSDYFALFIFFCLHVELAKYVSVTDHITKLHELSFLFVRQLFTTLFFFSSPSSSSLKKKKTDPFKEKVRFYY
ncbi:hypothetical protein STCU_10735 [Strigomonas culicis]|uniref:Uncharacterized protein n=1 Tax=Strigomonas culicis TaxID=28005 RepID=S9TGR9_9TRYP|nr:hypothetical protein STCU_10735 [Strigomonas culicis]|eukprot:EPY17247.1 hypothetical protein STCU_10735 [Strigomonas culicis]